MNSLNEISGTPRRSTRLMEKNYESGSNPKNLSVRINMLSTPTVANSSKNFIKTTTDPKSDNKIGFERFSNLSPFSNKESSYGGEAPTYLKEVTNIEMKRNSDKTVNGGTEKENEKNQETVQIPIEKMQQNFLIENVSKPLERTTKIMIHNSHKKCPSTVLQSEELLPQQHKLSCHIETISPNKEDGAGGHITMKIPENSLEIKFSNTFNSNSVSPNTSNTINTEIGMDSTFTLIESTSTIHFSQNSSELSSSNNVTETSTERQLKNVNIEEGKESEKPRNEVRNFVAKTRNSYNVNTTAAIEATSDIKETQETISVHDSACSNNDKDKTEKIPSIRVSTSTPQNKPKIENSLDAKTSLVDRTKNTNEIINSPGITPIKGNLNNSLRKAILRKITSKPALSETENSWLEKKKSKDADISITIIPSSDEEDNNSVPSPKKENIKISFAIPDMIEKENSKNIDSKPNNSEKGKEKKSLESFAKGNPTITSTKEKLANFSRKRSFSVAETNSEKLKLKHDSKTLLNNKKMVSHSSCSKMPNFSAIHKKQFEKMESIHDHVIKKASRAKILNFNINISKGNQTKETNNDKYKTKFEQKLVPNEGKSKIPILASKIESKQATRPAVFIFEGTKKDCEQNATKKDDTNLIKTQNRSKRFQEIYKNKLSKNSKKKDENSQVIRGFRSNKRFELQMKYRQEKSRK